MQIIDCTQDAHSDEMLAIFNEAIINSTALFDYQPRAPERMVEWFKAKTAGDFPVIGAISDDGQLLGFEFLFPEGLLLDQLMVDVGGVVHQHIELALFGRNALEQRGDLLIVRMITQYRNPDATSRRAIGTPYSHH